MAPTEAQEREISYLVKEGDTLSEIAVRHGVTVSDVRSWNRLDPKKQIQPGMRLVLRVRAETADLASP
jgi:LysM repeat protein